MEEGQEGLKSPARQAVPHESDSADGSPLTVFGGFPRACIAACIDVPPGQRARTTHTAAHHAIMTHEALAEMAVFR